MLKCELSSKYHIQKARDIVKRCPNLSDYSVFAEWWVTGISMDERSLLLAFAGVKKQANPYQESNDYVTLIEAPVRKAGTADVLKLLARNEKMALHRLHGRLMEAVEYTDVDLLFSNAMSSMLYRYVTRLGFKKPEHVLDLYRAGAMSDAVKADAEVALSSDFIDEVIPADTEVKFGENVNEMLSLVHQDKWQYIRLPNCIEVPKEIKDQLGRKTMSTFNGDLESIISQMAKNWKYSEEDIKFLYDYAVSGRDSLEYGSLPRSRKIKLIGDLKLRM